eukprot:NODE_205_length_14851_cov_0.317584.p7 type:complete len:145 gc:universal NODE_205_length_14851_cov_0.317584:1353-919(-)
MDAVFSQLNAIQHDFDAKIHELEKIIDSEKAEKLELMQKLNLTEIENNRLSDQLSKYKEMEEELAKLKVFKDTIISSLHEKTVVKDGLQIFKQAQSELNRDDYMLVVQHTKDFNSKLISKSELLSKVKSICSHELYMQFVDMVQ